jgi:hypothetical protein
VTGPFKLVSAVYLLLRRDDELLPLVRLALAEGAGGVRTPRPGEPESRGAPGD